MPTVEIVGNFFTQICNIHCRKRIPTKITNNYKNVGRCLLQYINFCRKETTHFERQINTNTGIISNTCNKL